MKRIGISQRVEDLPDRGERRDCLDQAWTPLLEQLGFCPIPIPNRLTAPEAFVAELQLDGIVLSGGNDLGRLAGAVNVAAERDECEERVIRFALDQGLPVLGVCRGMQLLTVFFGGQLCPVTGHIAVRHPIDTIPARLPGLVQRDEVNSFHGFGVSADSLPPDLSIAATSPDGHVEAIVHQQHRAAGIMWHPERAPHAPEDEHLIRTFLGEHKP